MLGFIFTYVMTFVGAFVALFNPFVGLLVYICFAIISPASMWPWSLGSGAHFSKIVAIAMLIGWMFKGFGQWNFGRSRGIFLAFSAFFLWAILSAFGASHQEFAWDFVVNISKIILPFVVGLMLIDSISKLKQLAWVMVGSLGFIAFEMNLSYFTGFNRVREMGFGSLDSNSIAIAMVAGVGLSFFLGVGATKGWQRLVAWAAGLLMAHTVMLSFSRGGMLALVACLVVCFVLLPPKKPIHLFALMICILIGFRLAGPEVSDRFLEIFVDAQVRDSSAQSRLDLWADMWDRTLQNPFLGVGPNNWPLVATEYGYPRGREGHSLWLQTAVELGLPGLVFLALFYGLCLIRLWPIVRSREKDLDPWYPNIARMVIAAQVGFIVSAQFVSLETLELPYYINLLGAGVLRLLYQPTADMAGMRSLRPVARFQTVSAATLLPSSKG